MPADGGEPSPTAPDAPEAAAPGPTPWWRRGRVWEAAATAVFTLWVAWPYLSITQYVTGYDTITYGGPHLTYTFEQWRAGRLPVWNDGIFNGVPHMANPQTAVLYPLKLLFLPVAPDRALEWITAAHIIVLAAGVWFLLARRLKLRPPAAFVGTVAVVGSGLVMVRSTQFEQMAVIAWVPWLLAAVDWAAESPRIRPRAVAAVAAPTGMMLVAGHPQQVYLAIPLVGVWAVVRAADRTASIEGAGARAGAALRRFVTIGLGALLGAGLSAVQLLVTAGQLSASVNTSGRPLMGAADPGLALTPSFIPSALFGQPWSADPAASAGSFETLGFVGITVCLLGLVGVGVCVLARGRRWTGAGLFLTAVVGVLLALGPECHLDDKGQRFCDPGGRLYRNLFDKVPGFDQARAPGRWMLVVVLAVAVLAALAVDALARREVRWPSLAIAGGLTVVGGLLIVTTPVEVNGDIGPTVAVWVVAGLATVALVVAGALLGGRHLGAVTVGAVAAVALAGLVVVEIGPAQRNRAARLELSDRSFAEMGGPTEAWLHDQPERNLSLGNTPLDDFAYLGNALRPNTNLTFGSRSLEGYDGGLWVTRDWVTAVDPLTKEIFNQDLPLTWQIEVPPSAPLLARYGVRYIVVDAYGAAKVYGIPNPESAEAQRMGASKVARGYKGPVFVDGGLQVWENPDWRGEGAVYFKTRPVDQTPAALVDALGNVRPNEAIVPPGSVSLSCTGVCLPQTVELRRPRPGAVDTTVTLTQSGLLVVPEQDAKGWTATVDGQPVDIVKTDAMSIGVPLQPGTHTVELRYQAPGLKAGGLVSLVSLVLLALCAWEPRWLRIRRWVPASTPPPV